MQRAVAGTRRPERNAHIVNGGCTAFRGVVARGAVGRWSSSVWARRHSWPAGRASPLVLARSSESGGVSGFWW